MDSKQYILHRVGKCPIRFTGKMLTSHTVIHETTTTTTTTTINLYYTDKGNWVVHSPQAERVSYDDDVLEALHTLPQSKCLDLVLNWVSREGYLAPIDC